MKYPKIETIFNRDEKFKVIEGDYRLPEFGNIKTWYVTEKIDGTNVRIFYEPKWKMWEENGERFIGGLDKMIIRFMGRTNKAQLHPNLVRFLAKMFTEEKMATTFPPREEAPVYPKMILFGEGYGPKIQKGGNYRKDISLRLFDVFIKDHKNPLGGWWLEPENVLDIAIKLGIETVPPLGIYSTDDAVDHVKAKAISVVSSTEDGTPEYLMEGIVARTKPLLFTRKGDRLIWKLKVKDLPNMERRKSIEKQTKRMDE